MKNVTCQRVQSILVFKFENTPPLTIFHIIFEAIHYHILLRSPWMKKYKFVASTVHHYVKAPLKGKQIHISTMKNHFLECLKHTKLMLKNPRQKE